MKDKKKTQKKLVRRVLICVFLATFLVSSWNLVNIISEQKESEKAYGELNEFVHVEETGGNNTTPVNPDTPVTPEENNQQPAEETGGIPKVDFDKLKEKSKNIVGWIYSAGTNISYPLMQGKNNSYYLSHRYDGAKNINGAIFIDYRNSKDFTDDHTIIYGHHMKNGSMLSTLTKYKKQAYYNEHKEILIMTEKADYRIKVFAGYKAAVSDNAWKITFKSEAEKKQWLDNAIAKSYFKSKVKPSASDRIVTLSTCDSTDKGFRFVLLGVVEVEEKDAD